eukprot:scaffold797_cov118-Skeletonema_dohrnii-CCMP3373.AAC.10
MTKIQRRRERRSILRQQKILDNDYLEHAITRTEDETTELAKANKECTKRTTIDRSHCIQRPNPSLLRKSCNLGMRLGTEVKRLTKTLVGKKGIRFARQVDLRHFRCSEAASMFMGISKPRPLCMATYSPPTTTPGLSAGDAIKAARKRAKRKAIKAAKKAAKADRRARQGKRSYPCNQALATESSTSTTIETNEVYASYDSAADGHYVAEDDRKKLNLPILRPSIKKVTVADGGIQAGKHQTMLPLHGLPEETKTGDSFDHFGTTLLSVGKVADAGNTSIFTRTGVNVYKEEDVLILVRGEPILVGKRDSFGRYKIPLVTQRGHVQPQRPTRTMKRRLELANSVYDLPSIEEAIKWMHAVCGFPVKSTWIKAIKAGNYQGWPLVNVKNVKKYYPVDAVETARGHMTQSRKNVRSTRRQAPQQPLETMDASTLQNQKIRDVYIKVHDMKDTIYTDQTGKVPIRSQRGNKYIMVMCEVDSNAILVEPMTSRKDKEMKRAYAALLKRLKRAGVVPKKHILDNEVSESLKEMIRDDYNMTLELVPPYCHRRNVAELAIRNFKAHLLSILAGVDDDFPMSLWDRLLPQAEVTLNLLRQSNATPTISAYAHLNGPFDYNRMPLAPMGVKVEVFESTTKRGTWDFHSVEGWYLNTSDEHYRTHNCHIKHTRSERLSNTVKFLHKHITNPTISHADKVMQAITDLRKTIKALEKEEPTAQFEELQLLVDAASNTIINNPTIMEQQAHTPVVQRQVVPRVTTSPPCPMQESASATAPPRVQKQSQPRVSPSTQSSHSTITVQPILRPAPRHTTSPSSARQATSPAMNTRSRTRAKQLRTGPAANTRSQTKAREHVMGVACAVQELQGCSPRASKRPSKQARKLAKRLIRMENEVQQAMAVMDQETGKMLNYRQLLRDPKYRKDWLISAANEFGRLAQGVGNRVKGTNTIKFIRKEDVPKQRMKDVTYGQFVCTVRPEKKEKNRTRFVVGGDRINYPGEVATPTAEMLVAKLLFNSVISTPNAKFMTMDIGNFYLNTPLSRPEYVRLRLSDIPDEIIEEYKLQDVATEDGS